MLRSTSLHESEPVNSTTTHDRRMLGNRVFSTCVASTTSLHLHLRTICPKSIDNLRQRFSQIPAEAHNILTRMCRPALFLLLGNQRQPLSQLLNAISTVEHRSFLLLRLLEFSSTCPRGALDESLCILLCLTHVAATLISCKCALRRSLSLSVISCPIGPNNF